MASPVKLSQDDEFLILQCKRERERLRYEIDCMQRQVKELTDTALARKFDVSTTTITAVK